MGPFVSSSATRFGASRAGVEPTGCLNSSGDGSFTLVARSVTGYIQKPSSSPLQPPRFTKLRMPISLLHCADTHLGVETYGRLDPATGLNTRLQDFTRSLRFIFQTAIDEHVDLVVFAGDAFRTCDPTPTHLRAFADAVRLLVESDIPLVMITGNHDAPVSFGKASSIDIFSTLGASHIFVADTPRLLDIDTARGPVQVACLPWLHRSRVLTDPRFDGIGEVETTVALASIACEEIDRLASLVDVSKPSILLAHAALSDAVLSGTERTAVLGRDPTLSTDTLARPEFDYVALGHIHRFQNLNPDGSPPVVYAGSIERVDFGEETEPKGAVLVEIADGPHPRPTSTRYVSTPARRFVTIEACVPPGADPTAVLVEAIERHDVRDAVVRVLYETDTETSPPDAKCLRTALRGAAHVALIGRRSSTPCRTTRAHITQQMGLTQAIKTYLSVHPELATYQSDLIDRALGLATQIEEDTA